MNIAVIPARGGSKRIPRKNIREFCGKPMIAWSIEAALNSGCFEKVVVSTDEEEVMQIAREHGAEVPFVRPPELADDFTPTIPVIRHAIDELRKQGLKLDHIFCLYATAPFVIADYLRAGLEKLQKDRRTQFVFSGTEYNFPIQRALKLDDQGVTSMFQPEYQLTRSQDLPKSYHDAGQFYWGTSEAWQKCSGIFEARSRLVLLPKHRVQDIDEEEDWLRAEAMFRSSSELG